MGIVLVQFIFRLRFFIENVSLVAFGFVSKRIHAEWQVELSFVYINVFC